jgi:N-acetylneuraminic acid mutarotase
MKKSTLFFVLFFCAISFSYGQCSFTTSIAVTGPTTGCGSATLTAGATGNVWTQKTSLGGSARQMAVGFSIGSKGYIGTGNGSSTTYMSDFWEYDPSTNAWTQKANFGGTARYGAVGFSIGSKGYVGTGYNGGVWPYYFNDFWEYDPSTNFWTQKANFGGSTRYLATGFTIGSKGYIGTGAYGSSYYNDFWEYDPSTNFWTQKANVGGGGRYSAVGFGIGSLGYIGTGYASSLGYTNDFWEYNPSTNAWTQKASKGGGNVYGAVGFSAGGKGYITTGYDVTSSIASDNMYEYNPTTNSWTQRTGVGSSNARYYGAAFAVGLKGYVGTGYNGGVLSTFWEYEAIGTYSWSTSETGQSIVVNSSGSFSVLVTAGNGCTATAAQTLSLSPNPTITVSGASVACAGLSNTLVASGAGSYTWSSNAGGGNSNTAIVTPTTATTYTVSGTTGSCSVNYSVTLNVNPLPSATIAVSGSTAGCGTRTLSTASGGNTWTQKAGLNTAREGAVAFSIGNKGYTGLGYNGNTWPYYMGDFWEYDPSTNAWTQKANFGGSTRAYAVGMGIGSKGYVGIGSNGSYLSDFWEYDPSANSWVQKATYSGGARANAVGVNVGSKGYVGTGYSNSWPYNMNDFYEYDPSTNTWTQKANFAGTGRNNAAGFAIGSKVYIGTGYDINNISQNDLYEYDPSNNTWAQKANFGGSGRYGAVGISIGNKGYLGTGNVQGTYVTDFWEYDQSTNGWTQRANFGGTGRMFGTGFALSGKVYLGTGELPNSPYYANDFWQYDPTNVILWSTSATTQSIVAASSGFYSVTVTSANGCSASSSQSLTLSPDPTITVSGGTVSCAGISNTLIASGASTYTWSSNAGGGTSNSVVVTPTVATTYTISGTTGTCTVNYPVFLNTNPVPVSTIAASGPTMGCGSLTLSTASAGNTWSQKAGLNTGREAGVAFSIGNKGYAGLGYNNNVSPYYLNDFWEYDPTTNAWTQKASFTGTGRMAAAGMCIGSKGYVGAGYNGNTSPYYLNDFFEYDPGTNNWTQKASLSVGRRYAIAIGTNSKGYLGLGYSSTWPYNLNDFYEYDPSTNSWTSKANFTGTGRYGAAAFLIGSKIYAGTGNDGSFKNDFFEYDISTNTWTQKANFAGSVRYWATGMSIGTKGYIGAGNSSTGNMNDLWEYDPSTNGWTQKTNFGGIARNSSVAFSIGGKGYLGYGYMNSSPYYANDMWQYDPSSTILWSTGANTQSITVNGSSTYSVTVTNGSGCTSSSSQAVALSPNPTISVTGGSIACAGTSNTLIASGAGSYTWSSNAGGGNTNSVIVSPTASTIYTVSGTTGTCTVNYPITMAVNSVPVATIAASGPTLGCGSLVLSTSTGTDSWIQKASLNSARHLAVAFSIGTKGYLGTGYNNSVSPYFFNDFWEYDPTTNAWTQKANFSGSGRYAAVGFSIGAKGYIGTGYDGSYKNDFYEYDPSTNSWTQKASVGSNLRGYAVGFGIGSKGYIGTGTGSSSYMSDFYEYDPSTNSWTQKANFGGGGRHRSLGLGSSTKGYIGTGYNGNYQNDFYEYDPSTNTWTQKANFSGTGRYSATGFVINNKVYIGSGYDGSYKNDLFEYDPAFNTWVQKANFGGAGRLEASGFSINGKGYLGAGYTTNYANDVWEYNPANVIAWSTGATTSSITVTASNNYSVTVTNAAGCSANASQSVALSPNPTITVSGANVACAGLSNTLIASGAGTYTWSANAGGGNTNSVIVTPSVSTTYTLSGASGSCIVSQPVDVNVYPTPAASIITIGSPTVCGTAVTLSANVPAGDTWTQKLGLNVGRRYAVSFSIGSKGYLGTGYNPNVSPYNYNDFWEYDPSNNSWTQKANFGGTARYGAVGFSIGSKGYIGTGYDGSYKSDFYEYDPSSNTWTQKANFGGGIRYLPAGFVIGSKGYVGTGYDGSYKNDFYEYDPSTNTWTQKANYGGTGRYVAVGFTIGSKGYIGTGTDGTNKSDFFEFDPSTNSWTQKANFGGSARNGAAAFSIANKAYVGGGNNYVDFWEYDQSTNTWTSKTNFGNQSSGYRTNPIAMSINGKGYMGNGYNGNYSNDFWEYNPSVSYAWSTGSTFSSITATTTGTYSLTVSNSFGCATTASQAISISPVPTISVNGPSVSCAGGSVTLSVSGASTYTWSANAGNAVASSVTVTPTFNTTYFVTGSANGCTATVSKPVTVNALPIVIANASSTNACTGGTVNLYGSGAASYTWSSGVTNNTPFSPNSTATYTLTGTDYNNCSNTTTVSVAVNPLPTISVNNGTICNGQNFTMVPSGANTYTYSSGSAIVSPNTNTSYSVTGTSIYGCVSTNTAVSNITVLTSPTVSVNSGTICAGQSFTMNPTGAISYTYSSGSAVVSPGSTTSYTVYGSASNGCPNASPAISTVTVQASPVISAASGSICAGNSYVINPSGAVTYTYSSGSPTVSPTSTTSYSVTGTSNLGCVSASPAVVIVTVNTIPVISVNSGTICNGQSFTMVPSGANTYTYSSGSAIVSPNTNTSYSVTGTSIYGCVSTNTAVAAVTVYSLPVISAANGTICEGESFTLTPSGAVSYTYTGGSQVVSPVSTTSYSISGTSSDGCISASSAVATIVVNASPVISVNNGTICESQSFTIVPSGAITYTFSSGSAVVAPIINTSYSVTGTDGNGCISIVPAISTVTVYTNPTITLPPTAYICTGNSYTIVPSGAATYTYSGGSNIITPNITTTYTVTGSSAQGCTGNQAVITVSVQSSLTVTIAGSNVMCEGQTIVLTGNGANTYTWNTGETTNSITVSPNTNTVYIVNAGSGLCSGSSSQSVTVNINPNVNASALNPTICVGESTSISAMGAISYSWNEGSQTDTVLVNPVITTTYVVTGTDNNGCSNTSSVTLYVSDCLGIYDINVSNLVRIYPNPNNGLVHVETGSLSENTVIELYNHLGQLVAEQKVESELTQLDYQHVANGVYTMKVVSSGKPLVVTKIIKQN